jgi:energy-converting hydrogenase Eha subunit E
VSKPEQVPAVEVAVWRFRGCARDFLAYNEVLRLLTFRRVRVAWIEILICRVGEWLD